MALSDRIRAAVPSAPAWAAFGLRRRWRGWWMLMTGLLCLAPAFAAGSQGSPWDRWREIAFEQLTVAGGLPHATTTSFAQADDGALWIGTFGGLVRYDGYRTQVFRQADDDRGLPDNYVRALAATPDGGVLVATTSGGVVHFDPASNRFLRLDASPTHGTGARVYALAPDHAGGFWIAAQSGLIHLRADLRTLERPAGAPTDTLFSVLQDRAGNVWAGTAHGLYVGRPGAAAFKRVERGDAAARAMLSSDIWALREDAAGALWVGTGSAGVVALGPRGKVRLPAALGAASPAIQRRTVRDILPAPDGRLWIATDGIGIALFDPRTGETSALRHDPGRPSSLGGDIVRALFLDRSGGLWAATESTASRCDTRPSIVHTLDGRTLFGPQGAQIDQNVRSVFTDRDGIVWLGFNRGHVAAVDPAHGRIRTLELPGHQADQDIRAIAQLDDGRIVAGARGLVTIDPATLAVAAYPVDGLDGKPVLALAMYQHTLMAGAYDGLYRIDADRHVRVYRHVAGEPHSLPDDQVRNIVPMPDGRAWIATTNGLGILSADSDAFETWRNVPGDATSLPQNYLGSIVPVGEQVWIGTYGGLARTPLTVPAGTRRFTAIRARDGLGSDNVAAVLPDAHGRLWAATTDGLSVIDPASGVIRTLGLRDGLAARFYNHRTAATGPDGELMFGGLDGLAVIEPDAPLEAGRLDAPLAITAITADERAIPFAQLPTPGHALTLPGDTHALRIRFALLDFTASADVRYSYRLDGFDQHWTTLEAGARPGTIYTNLPGGDYVLRLRASIPGLHARAVETALPLSIAPLWWERGWVRAALALLAIVLLLGVMQLRTRYLQRRAAELGRLVRERTSELQAANEQLRRLASTDELTGLLNRRALMQQLEHEYAAARQQGTPLSIVMLDLDAFKALNDRHGHLAGDDALRGVATIVRDCCRSIDHVGRYGGEEIMIILVHADMETAMPVAERMRAAIAATALLHGNGTLHLTASIGVATLLPDERPQDLVARADAALYRAKRAGRNTVERATA